MKNIKDLIDYNQDILVSGICDDSKLVKENYIFVATKGFNVDHYDYILDAVERGCSFLVVDREINFSFPHIIVENINSYYEELCRKFYDIDLSYYHFIGVTGTDGKTTTATIIKNLIGDTAYIGTNGLTIFDETIPISNTTPCISELYECLKKIRDAGISNVVMEVSSEALLHNRVSSLKFDCVGFTNITGDHLNVHGSFDEYVKCKMKLLDYLSSDGFVVVNGDDISLQTINHNNMYTFGFSSTNLFHICKVEYLKDKTIITLNYNDEVILIESPLIGKFNVYNVVESFIICLLFGIDKCLLLDRIKELRPIKGRVEFIDFSQEYDIVLDYAHTINGIKNIIDTFKGRYIITVCGCAGGREKEKRPIIGKYIMDNSNVSIFTMDDPRYEDVNDIIDEMVLDSNNYIRIINREEAIRYALSIAKRGDVVLILGKGRDNYMAIHDKKVYYSDFDVIYSYFN